jgi:hypothetical protein
VFGGNSKEERMTNEKKFEIAGPVTIVSTGKKEVKREAFEEVIDSVNVNPGAGSTLEDIYDQHSRLIYVVDVSISMQEGMLSEEMVKMYKWTPDLLKQFRAELEKEEAAKAKSNPPSDDDDDEEEEDEDIDPDDDPDEDEDDEEVEVTAEDVLRGIFGGTVEAPVASLSDEEIKLRVVMNNLQQKYGIYLQRDYAFKTKNRSKLLALKDAAKDFVKMRFKKFPDAQVYLYSFSDEPTLLAEGSDETRTLESFDRLYTTGGTNILRGVTKAVEDCRRTKDNIGANHIVLVSDGLDSGAMGVEQMLDRMKELRVVFDFIFMVGGSSTDQDDPVILSLRRACEATGGEFTMVKTEQDFQQKFLTASSRKCLPPGPVFN